jgi:hypothetical protein
MIFVQLPSHLPRKNDDYSNSVPASVKQENPSNKKDVEIPIQSSKKIDDDSPIQNDISDLSSGAFEMSV